MKKALTKLFTICISFMLFSSAKAQNDTTCKKGIVVKTDIFNLLSDVRNPGRFLFSASVEKFVSPSLGLQLTSFFGSVLSSGTYMQITFTDHEVEMVPEIKYYFGIPQEHKGFFAGGYILYENDFVVENNVQPLPAYPLPLMSITENYNFLGAGAVIGLQYYIAREIAIEVQLGIGAVYINSYNESVPDANNPETAYKTGISSSGFANINLGYKF